MDDQLLKEQQIVAGEEQDRTTEEISKQGSSTDVASSEANLQPVVSNTDVKDSEPAQETGNLISMRWYSPNRIAKMLMKCELDKTTLDLISDNQMFGIFKTDQGKLSVFSPRVNVFDRALVNYVDIFPLVYLCMCNSGDDQLSFVGDLMNGIRENKILLNKSKELARFSLGADFGDATTTFGLYTIVSPSAGGKSTMANILAEKWGFESKELIGESLSGAKFSSFQAFAEIMSRPEGAVVDSFRDLAFLDGNLGPGGIALQLYQIFGRLDGYCRLYGKNLFCIVNPLSLKELDQKGFVNALESVSHGLFQTSITKSEGLVKLQVVLRGQEINNRVALTANFILNQAEVEEIKKDVPSELSWEDDFGSSDSEFTGSQYSLGENYLMDENLNRKSFTPFSSGGKSK